jgi:hypothetical protein
MRTGDGRSWQSYIGIGVLILFSPVLLVAAWTVVVATPVDVATGLREVFSSRDVVQVADGFDTTVVIALLLVVLGGLGLLLRFSIVIVACGLLLLFPVAATLAAGVEYGLGALLASRGYGYCTFHVMSKDRGEGGTYVYVRSGLPEACSAVQRVFPPHQLVSGQRDSFDVSSSEPAQD